MLRFTTKSINIVIYTNSLRINSNANGIQNTNVRYLRQPKNGKIK